MGGDYVGMLPMTRLYPVIPVSQRLRYMFAKADLSRVAEGGALQLRGIEDGLFVRSLGWAFGL